MSNKQSIHKKKIGILVLRWGHLELKRALHKASLTLRYHTSSIRVTHHHHFMHPFQLLFPLKPWTKNKRVEKAYKSSNSSNQSILTICILDATFPNTTNGTSIPTITHSSLINHASQLTPPHHPRKPTLSILHHPCCPNSIRRHHNLHLHPPSQPQLRLPLYPTPSSTPTAPRHNPSMSRSLLPQPAQLSWRIVSLSPGTYVRYISALRIDK